jgi:predicted DNA-binding transcriptional regulator AlpA
MTDNTVSDSLKNTKWLAKKLNLSRSTIERLRKTNSNSLPPYILLGTNIRYDANTVDKWISQHQQAQLHRTPPLITKKEHSNDKL